MKGGGGKHPKTHVSARSEYIRGLYATVVLLIWVLVSRYPVAVP